MGGTSDSSAAAENWALQAVRRVTTHTLRLCIGVMIVAPVVFYFFLVGPLWKALVMLGWGIGVVSMIDQFLRPWLIGQGAQIPVFFLVFSVLGGLALYGLIGLFVGPVLVSLLMTIIQIYREEYQNADTGTPTSPPTPS